MSSDKINSISDTVESEQVASIIKDTYFNLLNTLDQIPENKQLIQLGALGDLTRPNYMVIPDGVLRIETIRYNVIKDGVTDQYCVMKYYNPEEFLQRSFYNNTTDAAVIRVPDIENPNVHILIRNDKSPEFYTLFDDQYVVFDSYDVSIEDTLQEHKSVVHAQVEPAWSTTDTFVPALDSNLFPLLLAESKSLCFVNLKEIANPKVEQVSRGQKVSIQNNKKKTRNRYNTYPNFGR